jgi:hypothetical protein
MLLSGYVISIIKVNWFNRRIISLEKKIYDFIRPIFICNKVFFITDKNWYKDLLINQAVQLCKWIMVGVTVPFIFSTVSNFHRRFLAKKFFN